MSARSKTADIYIQNGRRTKTAHWLKRPTNQVKTETKGKRYAVLLTKLLAILDIQKDCFGPGLWAVLVISRASELQ